jgi:hypothetical protein
MRPKGRDKDEAVTHFNPRSFTEFGLRSFANAQDDSRRFQADNPSSVILNRVKNLFSVDGR